MTKADLDDYEVEGIDAGDSPDFCDAYISRAAHADGTEFTEEELDDLHTNHAGLVCELIYDWIY